MGALMLAGSVLVPVNAADPGVQSPAFGPIVLNLLLVLAVIGALAWFLRRSPLAARSNGFLQVKGSVPLGQRERLVLVRFAEKELLLGVNGQRITVLAERKAPLVDEESSEPRPQPKSFAALLERLQ